MDRTSLEGLAHKLLEFAAAGPAGRSASTVYGGREQVLRQTLIALTAGTSLSEHCPEVVRARPAARVRQRPAAWQGAQNRACGSTSSRWAGMALPQRSHRPYVP